MNERSQAAALVLCSGGQDSTTCLKWAANRFTQVYSLAFNYGQRHAIELEAAATVAEKVGVVEHRVLPINALAALAGNSLTGSEPVTAEPNERNGLPNTFVPGRNLLFLTLAAAWAYQLDITDLVTGVCQTDYSGYPDCREQTMDALALALRTGMEVPFTIHTPLMHLTKAESIDLAKAEGGLDLLAFSHTCYNGTVPPCGVCPACVLRAKGFEEAGEIDPLIARLERS